MIKNIQPKEKFKVGDKIEFLFFIGIGTVKEVLPNNKYKVKYKTRYLERGYPSKKESLNLKEFHWFELTGFKEKKLNTKTLKKKIKSVKAKINFHDTNLYGLVKLGLFDKIKFNNDYQRDFEWEEKDKIELINSIFNGVDIGSFTFIPLKESNNIYEILDGKQRLLSILEFVTDQFKYQGKYFSELHNEDRMFIRGYRISHCETKENLSEKEKISYYLSLNTRGKVQNSKHLNKLKKKLESL